MHRLIAATALALLLSVAGAADAKLPGGGLRFCGLSGCRTVSDLDVLSKIGLALAGSDRHAQTPPVPSPYYTVRWADGGRPIESWPGFYYVPSAGLVRVEEIRRVEWFPLREAQAAFDSAARGIAAFQGPRSTRVSVGKREARDPSSYLRLYELLSRGDHVADPLGPRPALEWRNYKTLVRYFRRERLLWIPIRLRTARPSPWSDEATQLSIGRHHDLLRGDGTVVRIQHEVAVRVRRGAPVGS
jgi:hypothetical protein